MKTLNGGHMVNGGYYFNLRDWKLEVVEGATGVLPGDAAAQYRRVPVLAMVVLAPVMGLAFVVLLPFIGLAVIAEQVGRQLRKLFNAPKQVPEAKAANPLR
jgi:hypothetical protein